MSNHTNNVNSNTLRQDALKQWKKVRNHMLRGKIVKGAEKYGL